MYDSNRFYMWEDQIIFHDGWFIFLDGKGNASVISHKRARERERDFQGYQANMDVGKGGLPYDIAYRRRGFTNENGEFVYRNYKVDKLIKGTIHPITSVLTIPERVGDICINAIDDKAFFCETVIEKVVLHKDILIIGSSAFEGCVNLKELVIPGEHVIISKDAFKDTALQNNNGTYYLGNTLVSVAPGLSGTLVIKNSVSVIADEALKNCRELTEVILPDNLISIGNQAFQGCTGIRSVILPGMLRSISSHAFSGCSGLEKIVFPKKMDTIGIGAFSDCTALKSVHLPDGISKIENALFKGCDSLTDVRIPDSVIGVGLLAFEGCGLMNEFELSDKEELYIDNWLICSKADNNEEAAEPNLAQEEEPINKEEAAEPYPAQDKEPTDQKEATEPYPAKEKEPIDETQTQKLSVKKMEFLFQDGAAFSAGDVRYIHRYYFDPESKSYYMTDINDNNPVRITEEQLNSGKRAKEEFDRAMKEKAGNNQSKETMIIAGARTEKSGKISVKNAHSSEVIPPQIPGRFKGKQLPLKTREEIDFWEQEVANANANRNADMSLWEKISKMKKVESVYVHSIPDCEYPEDREMDWDTYLYQYRAVHQKLSFINHNSSEEI